MQNQRSTETSSVVAKLGRAALIWVGVLLALLCTTEFPAAGANAADQIFRKPTTRAEMIPRPLIGERERRLSPQDLETQLEGVLKTDLPERRPLVLVLPVADEGGRVRDDGFGLCLQAMQALADGPQQRLFPCPDSAMAALVDAGCARQGAEINPRLAGACAKAVDATLFVRSTLSSGPDGWALKVELIEDGALAEGARQHVIARGKLNTVPGLIAFDIAEHLGLKLDPEERERVLSPQVGSDEASAILGDLLAGTAPFGETEKRLRAFVRVNPRCALAWAMLLLMVPEPVRVLEEEAGQVAGLNMAALEVSLNRRLLAAGRPEQAWTRLIAAAPRHAGDTRFIEALIRCAARLGQSPLAERLFDRWQRLDDGYGGKLLRGRLRRELAESWNEGNEAESRRALLARAREEFEAAVGLNPDGWQAHSELVGLAADLDFPREEVESHFKRVIEVVPGNAAVYRRKLAFLNPRRMGTDSELFAFARECIATGRWQDGIPQLTLEAVQSATFDRSNFARRYSAFQSPLLWPVVEEYYREALEHAWSADRRTAINLFALWGAWSGHYAEVSEVFRLLKNDYERTTYDELIFGNPFQLGYLLDLTEAHAASGIEAVDAGLRVALSAADLEEAERLLAALGDENPSGLASGYHSMLKRFRQLESERRVELSAEQLLNVLVDQTVFSDPVALALASRPNGWSIRGERVVWPGGKRFHTYFPIGIRQGTISGTIDFSGGVRHARVLLHTRSRRDVITLSYKAEPPTVTVARGAYFVANLPCEARVNSFRAHYGADEDLVEPVPGQVLRFPVLDDVPGGIAFDGGVSGGNSGTFGLSHLKIELDD